MPVETWIFSNEEDGARIRFRGDPEAAQSFLVVLRTYCQGRWKKEREAEASPSAQSPSQQLQSESRTQSTALAAESVHTGAPAPLPTLEPTIVSPVAMPQPPLPPVRPPSMPAAPAPAATPTVPEPDRWSPVGSAARPSSELPGTQTGPQATEVITQVSRPGAYSEQRKSKRYSAHFRIILSWSGKSFRSQSQDISIGGMKLKHRPPEAMWGQVCTVFIGSPFAPENIELKCKLIPDPRMPERAQFLDASPESLAKLEEWILAVEEAIRAGKRAA